MKHVLALGLLLAGAVAQAQVKGPIERYTATTANVAGPGETIGQNRSLIVGLQRNGAVRRADAGVDVDIATRLHREAHARTGHRNGIANRDVIVRLKNHIRCGGIDRGGSNGDIG